MTFRGKITSYYDKTSTKMTEIVAVSKKNSNIIVTQISHYWLTVSKLNFHLICNKQIETFGHSCGFGPCIARPSI